MTCVSPRGMERFALIRPLPDATVLSRIFCLRWNLQSLNSPDSCAASSGDFLPPPSSLARLPSRGAFPPPQKQFGEQNVSGHSSSSRPTDAASNQSVSAARSARRKAQMISHYIDCRLLIHRCSDERWPNSDSIAATSQPEERSANVSRRRLQSSLRLGGLQTSQAVWPVPPRQLAES